MSAKVNGARPMLSREGDHEQTYAPRGAIRNATRHHAVALGATWIMTNAILTGLMLGGMYALVAMGLTLQYGVARIMNLSYGEFLIAAAFASHWLFTAWAISPFVGLVLVVPVAFVREPRVYKLLLTPLVRRAPTRDALEVDSILATFGLTFIIQGSMLALFGGAYHSYSYLAFPVHLLGETIAANRLAALAVAVLLGAGALSGADAHARRHRHSRGGRRPGRSRSSSPSTCRAHPRLTFALGGALVAAAGVLVSTFLTFSRLLGRRVHDEGADRGRHGRRRQPARLPDRGPGARAQRVAGRLLSSIRA